LGNAKFLKIGKCHFEIRIKWPDIIWGLLDWSFVNFLPNSVFGFPNIRRQLEWHLFLWHSYLLWRLNRNRIGLSDFIYIFFLKVTSTGCCWFPSVAIVVIGSS
jgi:hypothetical protein